jgi:hypothetical protein
MAKPNVAAALGLLCFLAATCTTGCAGDVQQNEFAIEGSVGPLRGTVAMHDASSMSIESELLEGLTSELSPEQMLDTFRKERSRKLHKHTYQKVKIAPGNYNIIWNPLDLSGLDALIDFANTDLYFCSLWQVKLFLHVNRVGQSPPPLLKEYMNHYGAKKFKSCADRGLEQLRRPKGIFEHKFDNFFRVLLGLSEEAGDEDLWKKLRQTNLLEDELNFSGAMKSGDGDSKEPNSSGVNILKYLKSNCDVLENYTGLESIILSDAWQGGLELNDRTRKLIEYQNACWYVLKYPSELVKNVDRQRGLAAGYLGNLGDLDDLRNLGNLGNLLGKVCASCF